MIPVYTIPTAAVAATTSAAVTNGTTCQERVIKLGIIAKHDHPNSDKRQEIGENISVTREAKTENMESNSSISSSKSEVSILS